MAFANSLKFLKGLQLVNKRVQKKEKKKKEKKVPSCIRTSGHLDWRATMISITPRGTRIEDL